jgi:protein-tyrosine kinase
MSRFFRTVQEASRHGQLTDLSSAWDNPAATPEEAEALLEREPEAVVAEQTLGAGMDEAWPLSEAEPLLHTNGSADSSLGIPTQIAIDGKTPLLSRALEPYVLEYYRRLRTKIIQHQAVKPFRSLIVTSPNPQEGKTVTTLNLGLIFAMLPNFEVLIIDGDLRRGSLSKWLGADSRPGLGNLIDGSANIEDVILKSDKLPMKFMVRGNSKTSAAEVLHSPQLGKQMRRVTEHFPLVLVDSPPVNLITDTQLLAASCDAVLLVARAFVTTRKSLERTAADLQTFRVIGTVLNGSAPAGPRRYRGYY